MLDLVRRAIPCLLVLAVLVSIAPPVLAEEEIDAATAKARLEEAYKSGSDLAIEEAIGFARGIQDPTVVKLVAKGIRTRSYAVIEAALKSLGATDAPEALKALHDTYWRVHKKKLEGYEPLFGVLLEEIGRHGDPSSIEVLSSSPFSNLTLDAGRARLMGLGNIRDPKSVDALIQASRLSGGRGAAGVGSAWRGRFRKTFRVAMATLTGHDEGEIPLDWDRWVRDNKESLEIAKDRPKVPEDVSEAFEAYWGVPYYKEGDEPAPPTLEPPFDRVLDPSKEQVKAAVDALKAAYRTKDDDTIVNAIERNAGILGKKVVHEIASGARYRSHRVQMVAVQALGWMRYDAALKQLHRIIRREKNLHKTDEVLFAELLKAIGRSRSPSSIPVLMKSPFKGATLASGRARIYGLGNIRDKRSVTELMKATQLAGGTVPRSWRPLGENRFQDEFLLSLRILTGVDHGRKLEEWRQWWRKNGKKFKVSPERPPIPEEMQKTWETYWNEPYYE